MCKTSSSSIYTFISICMHSTFAYIVVVLSFISLCVCHKTTLIVLCVALGSDLFPGLLQGEISERSPGCQPVFSPLSAALPNPN